MNRPRAPLFATINVTGQCNLACRYCFFQPRPREAMVWDDYERVINELSDLQVFFVNISGGEPFTHPQIDRFIRFVHERFAHVVVITNGTILEEHHIQAIRSVVVQKGGFPIQVSIDAIDPEVNARTRGDSRPVLANLEKLKALEANIVIAMVATKFNIAHMPSDIAQLASTTRFFHIMPFQPVKALHGTDCDCELSADESTALWQRVRSIRDDLGLHIDTPLDEGGVAGCASGAPCMAAFSHLVIDSDMRVRPCDRLVETTIGDLKKSTLTEIWNGEPASRLVSRPSPLCHA